MTIREEPGRPQPVPVTILTGFLGAGKTSLLNHILTSAHGKRIAVLVNDFGSVNIDASLIEGQDGGVVSLENGCICCSLSEGLLMAAVQTVRRQPPPEHIVIETSGVSDPVEVARTFSDPELQPFAPLEGIVAVVDAEQSVTLDGEMLQVARRQLRAADIAVLNKTDLVDDAGRARARAWVAREASHVRVVETAHGRVPLELILDIGGGAELPEPQGRGEPARREQHEQAPFDTYTYECDEPMPLERLHEALRCLPQTVFRVKGMVNLVEKPGNPCVLQSTARRASLTVGRPWGDRTPRTQIVFIGSRGGVDSDTLRAVLSGRTTREDDAVDGTVGRPAAPVSSPTRQISKEMQG